MDDVCLPSGWVRVRGGVAGTVAHLTDLEAAAGLLGRAADVLGSAVHDVPWLRLVVADAAAWSPGTADAAERALDALERGPSGLRAVEATLRETGSGLRRAADGYREAETAAHRSVAAAAALGRAVGELGPVGGMLGAAVAGAWAAWALRDLRAGRLRPSRLADQLVAGTSGFLVGVLPGRGPRLHRPTRLAAGLLDRGLGLARPRTRLAVAQAPPPTRVPPEPPSGLGDVLRTTDALYAGEDARVGVQRLVHADGTSSWVVAIPGTRSMAVAGGSNPADNASNVALVGARPEDASALVVEAMRRAGIGPDEPVLLAGHSQGGAVAMAVASDPALAGEFDVAAVVTAGSPIAGFDLPDGVQALHLESLQDAVTGADGAVVPGAPNRTTVHVDLAQAPSERLRAAASDPLEAHGAATYAEAADHLPLLGDPSVRHVVDGPVARVLGGDVVDVVTWTWTGRRVRAAPGT